MEEFVRSNLTGEDTHLEVCAPKTPAEFPINVPLLVTELRILLIRKRALETARGRVAPSFRPHKPPIARPEGGNTACQNNKKLAKQKILQETQARHQADELFIKYYHSGETRLTTQVCCSRSVLEIVTPTTGRKGRACTRQITCFIII